MHNIYTTDEITVSFKIQEEHTVGFLYFVAKDKEVAAPRHAGNESLAKLRVTEFAQKIFRRYKTMIKWLTILLLACTTAFCQERRPLAGKVIAGGAGIQDVFVINKATGNEVKTNNTGNFSIAARAGDRLAVYSAGVDAREFVISEASFKEVPYVLEVNSKSTELEEVVVQGSTVTSESLGIVPKGQKKFTVAERRVFTATEGTDALFNRISGRTKMLEKAAETEKKETVIDALNGLYTDPEVTEQFGIPAENVRAFMFYAAEDAPLAAAVKANNTSLVKLLMIDIAKKYLAAIKE